jgi:hypothetical protein
MEFGREGIAASGQYRAMRDGIVGNVGIDSNVESATYGRCEPVNGSNLTLTAI